MHNTFKNTDYLEVRPILQSEDLQWNSLVSEHHYLGFNGLIGEQIKYIAILNGGWVGLLAWAACSYRCGDRDKWIGWKSFKSNKNLKFIANNWRFLILPGIQIKNLASKILSENLNRLNQDWVNKYKHEILLVETFFSIPGLGGMTVKAINTSDFPVIKAMTVLSAVGFIIFNLITDILYTVVDPRMRLK